ncbi:sigma-70 family RNA polymerase sigma factor [Pseudomonas nicosulfuronedens]|uniref:Sigma-70 family RNA polymerase sigma factor n=1 Tax=Pseudomonas nicosulfuronedens TaxID=2571105 RepID=A0A5R9QRM5_9PSED|nr:MULTISPECIES: sigma-70 family RNA polymerase sigma factor [Pseudomonas]MDH1012721.1 sigma-70 family RNA polymerase sigma factor [Pseudomonas nicosulfuronedens]MDH1980047.1 sigma-70 family RNA polymerase sigma factor [Pseudomonas nicosulfuronedens]MDH2030377.1 sigma-70 family RNA polymerase sigma factor [Pseudomonas nicosulfuronedens]TLX72541.1 sigma-70 family RNA polymerase sigma factor [Pseudomonas nicosulfuronedens]
MPPVDAPLHAAVSELYQHHHGWLQGWLRRRLDCHEQAADLAQDTFTRLLGSRRVLDAREPRAYLTTIAKGLMINWFQRQSLERAYLEALAGLPEELAPSPEQRYLVLETLHEIDALLARLPDPVRQAFLLAQIEGLKYEAIAQRLGVSLGSVKRYMQQAFRHCLELME